MINPPPKDLSNEKVLRDYLQRLVNIINQQGRQIEELQRNK